MKKNEKYNIKENTIENDIRETLIKLAIINIKAFNLKNKKIKTNFGKATIQVEDPIEGKWIKEIFKSRAEGKLTDEEIVENLNLKGYISRKGKKLTIKQMQYYIKTFIYAGIIVSKWTGNKPIKTAYDGLVSIEMWNRANRGKVKIKEISKDNIIIEYNNKNIISLNQPIIKKRKNYNPIFCYSKVLICPICKGNLTGGSSRGANGSLHQYYFCKGKGGNKHLSYSLKRDIVHNDIIKKIKSLKIDNNILNLYDNILEEVFNDRLLEMKENRNKYIKELEILNKKEKEIIDNINKLINFPLLLESKNKEIENIKREKEKLLFKISDYKGKDELDKFKIYGKKILTHLDKLVIQKENPDIIKLVFDIIYGGNIEYERLKSNTHILHELSVILNKKINSQKESSSKNLNWQPH